MARRGATPWAHPAVWIFCRGDLLEDLAYLGKHDLLENVVQAPVD